MRQRKPIKAPEMTEKQLSRAVIDFARSQGWIVYHTFLSKWSEAGYPDLHCIRFYDRDFYVELKSSHGKLTEKQHEYIEALRSVERQVFVWRPADWDDGTIVKELLRRANDTQTTGAATRRAEEGDG